MAVAVWCGTLLCSTGAGPEDLKTLDLHCSAWTDHDTGDVRESSIVLPSVPQLMYSLVL